MLINIFLTKFTIYEHLYGIKLPDGLCFLRNKKQKPYISSKLIQAIAPLESVVQNIHSSQKSL
jgi:hypothetical protein